MYLGAETSDGSSSITVSGVYLENATAVFGRTEGAGTGLTSDVLAQAVVGVQESSASQEVLVRAGIASTQQTFSNVNACFEALGQGPGGTMWSAMPRRAPILPAPIPA